jgi:hypothetical protein
MLKDNPVAINFQNKLDLVRTRTGFSQSGEQEALNILSSEYLKYIATEMFNGSLVNIPGLDNNLSQAYQSYISEYNTQIAENLFTNGNLTIDKIGELSNSQWICMLLNALVEVDGESSNLREMFKVLEQVAQEVGSKDLKKNDDVEKEIENTVAKLDSKTRSIYEKLQTSKLVNNYGSLNILSAVNLGLSQEQLEAHETILNEEDLTPESLKARQLFESIFKTLTTGLPINRLSENVDHRMVYVTRTGGTDYSGVLKYDENNKPYMLWKFDFKSLGIASLKNTMSPNEINSFCDTVVHEIAHQLEMVGARKPGTHDEIFNELMKANYAKLLNNPK